MVELTGYNPEEFEPLGSFEVLPADNYVVVIESSEKRKASTGEANYYLQFVYNVVEGKFAGRKIFDRLNVENESAQAETIAKRALASICLAVGAVHPKNTEELHDKPFMVNVGIRPAKGTTDRPTLSKVTRCRTETRSKAPQQLQVRVRLQ